MTTRRKDESEGSVPLARERKNTDDSLIAERTKTNRSLAHARTETEREVDGSRISRRLEIDDVLTSDRDVMDLERDRERALKEYDPRDEQRIGDERVRLERERADHALGIERVRTDSALARERSFEKQIAHRLLAQERSVTDTNLSTERRSTDRAVDASSKRLSAEISEHLKTKVSLTSRDEFLAIVSHDLRHPIGAATSALDILIEELEIEGAKPDMLHWAEFAKRNLETSLRLIADLLDLERIAQGKFHLDARTCDIDALVDDATSSFSRALAVKGITLEVERSPGPSSAVCDYDRVLQVLSNLIGNAHKFTPEGGAVTVSTKAENDSVEFVVRDTGPGIAPEKLTGVFDRFNQLNSNDGRGLGLGLHIAKILTEAHRGRIWVESKLGAGSSFHFTIPIDHVD